MFLAWGSPAQKRCEKINGAKHLVLKSVHPSPLSAHKGFFDCGHFRKTNEWLESRYGEEGVINWDLNAPVPIKAPVKREEVKFTPAAEKESAEGESVKAPIGKKDTEKTEDADEFDLDDDEDAIAAMEELASTEEAASQKKEDS